LDGEIPGVAISESGAGMCVACNRKKGIRAATCHDIESTEIARKHINANILCMGGKITDPDKARKIVDTFIDTEFSGGKFKKLVGKIDG